MYKKNQIPNNSWGTIEDRSPWASCVSGFSPCGALSLLIPPVLLPRGVWGAHRKARRRPRRPLVIDRHGFRQPGLDPCRTTASVLTPEWRCWIPTARHPHHPIPRCPASSSPTFLTPPSLLHSNGPAFCWARPASTDPLRLRKSTEVGFFVSYPWTVQGGGRVMFKDSEVNLGLYITVHLMIALFSWKVLQAEDTPLWNIASLSPPF